MTAYILDHHQQCVPVTQGRGVYSSRVTVDLPLLVETGHELHDLRWGDALAGRGGLFHSNGLSLGCQVGKGDPSATAGGEHPTCGQLHWLEELDMHLSLYQLTDTQQRDVGRTGYDSLGVEKAHHKLVQIQGRAQEGHPLLTVHVERDEGLLCHWAGDRP